MLSQAEKWESRQGPRLTARILLIRARHPQRRRHGDDRQGYAALQPECALEPTPACIATVGTGTMTLHRTTEAEGVEYSRRYMFCISTLRFAAGHLSSTELQYDTP